ncbi:unnamed protein product [Nippostrongylus brasiliensis]|uniref:Uncharacterized protein n=1 Tax=Nippostrongylus brasiliensis TaxID=27835 RepID=A0A0N4XRW2_NIPBR|nr:unnamed protein product [Nippostrongylus brasiliensis]
MGIDIIRGLISVLFIFIYSYVSAHFIGFYRSLLFLSYTKTSLLAVYLEVQRFLITNNFFLGNFRVLSHFI